MVTKRTKKSIRNGIKNKRGGCIDAEGNENKQDPVGSNCEVAAAGGVGVGDGGETENAAAGAGGVGDGVGVVDAAGAAAAGAGGVGVGVVDAAGAAAAGAGGVGVGVVDAAGGMDSNSVDSGVISQAAKKNAKDLANELYNNLISQNSKDSTELPGAAELPGDKPASAALGGRRRSRRRRQKKSAKKSKKGGRSRKNCGSKNRRKYSRRR